MAFVYGSDVATLATAVFRMFGWNWHKKPVPTHNEMSEFIDGMVLDAVKDTGYRECGRLIIKNTDGDDVYENSETEKTYRVFLDLGTVTVSLE